MAKILIIDDNEEFRSVFKEVLEMAQYEVVEAGDGEEGIKVYHQEKPDLVIVDMIMPVKEGMETIIELHKEKPGLKIIAISGDGFEEPMTYLEGADLIGGAQRSFAKPFSMEKMLKTIKELLSQD